MLYGRLTSKFDGFPRRASSAVFFPLARVFAPPRSPETRFRLKSITAYTQREVHVVLAKTSRQRVIIYKERDTREAFGEAQTEGRRVYMRKGGSSRSSGKREDKYTQRTRQDE